MDDFCGVVHGARGFCGLRDKCRRACSQGFADPTCPVCRRGVTSFLSPWHVRRGSMGVRKSEADQNAKPNAAYLPRTWAKLEIDRLLANDSVKHKDTIVALSKLMYVI